MKTIGLIGGMSWESSSEYYRLINEGVRERVGRRHSAKSVMVSVDFAEIEWLQRNGQWIALEQAMVAAAQQVERGGADFLVLCTNTMHRVAEAIQAGVDIPLLHIAEATAEAIKAQGITRVGLLGTRFTMEGAFYRGYLVGRHRLEVLVPPQEAGQRIHDIIYHELVLGQIKPESRAAYVEVMEALIAEGAQGIILGCTEIGLLVGEGDVSVPVFDTTKLHAAAAVTWALDSD